MSKNARKDIPADMWLHVATDALARYIAAGGTLELAQDTSTAGEEALMILLPLAIDDPRLAPAFAALLPAPDTHQPAETIPVIPHTAN